MSPVALPHRSHIAAVAALLVLASINAGLCQDSALRPGDTISIDVYEEPSLQTRHTINSSGYFEHTLLGKIEAAGRSPGQVQELLRELLDRDYIIDPKVSVSLTERPDGFVTVIGAVKSGGRLPFKPSDGIDLHTAIATAGGLADAADENRIVLQRGGKSVTHSMAAAKRVQLRDKDTIVVNSLGKLPEFTVTGEIRKPGKHGIPRGETLTLIEAIAIAGGVTDVADRNDVRVQRTVDGKVETIELDRARMLRGKDEPFVIQPGDVVEILESRF